MYNPEIDRLIDSWKDELIETLRGWIAIPSEADEAAYKPGAPFGADVRKMLDKALSDAQKMGFDTDDVDGYAGEVTLRGSGESTMGILAHLDIVPAGDGWVRAPFGGEVADGKLYGRGASDDKGPAVAALYAMRAVREAGVKLRDSVKLILGCDEENGMGDMHYYREHRPTPDYAFSPDAEYPLINIEKGGLHVALTAFADGEGQIPVYKMFAGERVNVVPGLAWAEVGTQNASADEMNRLFAEKGLNAKAVGLGEGRARIEAEGVSAHASMPELGVNACGILFTALRELGAGSETLRSAIAALAEKVGLEGDGKSLGIAQSDGESGALTCNWGLLRYDGSVLEATLDIRYPLCADPAAMCGSMAVALGGTPVAVKYLDSHPVHYVPADHKVVKGLLEVYHDITGLPAYPIAIGGGTYSQTMPNTVAFGICFPGEEDPCHMPDEFVKIDSLLTSVKIMAHAIEKLAGE